MGCPSTDNRSAVWWTRTRPPRRWSSWRWQWGTWELWHLSPALPWHLLGRQGSSVSVVGISSNIYTHLYKSHITGYNQTIFINGRFLLGRILSFWFSMGIFSYNIYTHFLQSYNSWLVVEPYPSEKYESQMGWWNSQYDGKVIKFHGSKPPTRQDIIQRY